MSSKTLDNKRVALHNLGCKVNSYETFVMKELLENAGCEIVDFEDEADIYIVNTCSVTNIADRKSRQMLHKARKKNPEALIIAAGCYVQGREPEEVIKDGVDLLVGNDNKGKLIGLIEAYYAEKKQWAVEDMSDKRPYEDMLLTKNSEMTRLYIKVEDGCDQFCSYCMIPYLRGRVRSRKLSEIVREIEGFEGRYPEIVLTGINLSAYGKDLDSQDLISLIGRINDIPSIKRIRVSSLEPRIVTRESAEILAGMEKVCPHFHLSLQSGCDRTLKRMNRHYTGAQYMEAVGYLRESFRRERGAYPALTTDVIVGFPGESEEDFRECEDFLREIAFFETHVFKYSARKGTAAAKYPDQLTDRVKSERSARLIALCGENRRAFMDELVKNEAYTPELLVEEYMEAEGKRYQVGHTGEYVKTAVLSDEDLRGKIVAGRLDGPGYIAADKDICIMRDFEVK